MSDNLVSLLFDALERAVPKWAFWTITILLVVTIQYWLGPILVHAKVRQKRATRFSPAGTTPPMPPPLADFFTTSATALQQAGFTSTPPFYGVCGDEQTGSAAYFQLFQHPDHGDVATIMAMARPLPVEGPPVSLVGFTAEFADGGSQRTGNSAVGIPFPPRTADHTARFPTERDPARLYALHRALVRRRGGTQRRVPLTDPLAYQRRQEQLTHQRMISSGYYRVEGDELRPTWKGACLGAWKMLAPWKDRLAARDERLRQRLASDLGFA
jgi:hypothetical protein